MKLFIAIGITVGAAIFGSDAREASVPAPSAVTGRVVYVGPIPASDSTVKFKGEAPESKPLVIEASKSEGCVHDGSVDDTDRSLMISDGGGLANVVVTIEVDGAEVKIPDAPFVMDQKSCRFEPHVTVINTGTTVQFQNSDDISHNVHTYAAKNDNFNQMIGSGANHKMKYAKADRVEIKCDVHPWMNSFLIVTDEPFFAVTGADGSFSLPKLPAGKHKVEYWHEKLGKNKGEITVGDDGSAEAILLEWGEEKKSGRGRRR